MAVAGLEEFSEDRKLRTLKGEYLIIIQILS